MEDMMEEILKKITQTRKKRGLSLENMGFELGISDSAYRKIENNQSKLSLENFLKIAKTLEVTANELLDEKPHNEYNQSNNDQAQGTFIGHQEFQNFYQENKEITFKLIDSLEAHVKHLQEENSFLRNQLSNQ